MDHDLKWIIIAYIYIYGIMTTCVLSICRVNLLSDLPAYFCLCSGIHKPVNIFVHNRD